MKLAILTLFKCSGAFICSVTMTTIYLQNIFYLNVASFYCDPGSSALAQGGW